MRSRGLRTYIHTYIRRLDDVNMTALVYYVMLCCVMEFIINKKSNLI